MMQSDLSGIRLVSWDVDGTLFSYLRLSLELFRTTLQSAHQTGWTHTWNELCEIWEFHRDIERQRRNWNCGVMERQMEAFGRAQTCERQAMERALRRMPPRPEAVTVLESIAASGRWQVALSDFECQYKLDALGLSRHFQKAYSCRQIGFWKPSPIPLAMIQREFGIRPEQHLHIGDRLDADGEACLRNGCRFLPVNRLRSLWSL